VLGSLTERIPVFGRTHPETVVPGVAKGKRWASLAQTTSSSSSTLPAATGAAAR
jgi:hypothetical protein